MGYSLHLEKNGSPGDESGPFSLAEWTALRAIPGFPACVTLMDGWLEARNPSPPEIAFLVNAAKTYGWTVQGDDGETCASDGRAIPPAFGLGAITVRFPDGVELPGLFGGHGFELEG